jgi:hypothetical protein
MRLTTANGETSSSFATTRSAGTSSDAAAISVKGFGVDWARYLARCKRGRGRRGAGRGSELAQL